MHRHVLNFISKVYYFDSVHLRHKIFHNFFFYLNSFPISFLLISITVGYIEKKKNKKIVTRFIEIYYWVSSGMSWVRYQSSPLITINC